MGHVLEIFSLTLPAFRGYRCFHKVSQAFVLVGLDPTSCKSREAGQHADRVRSRAAKVGDKFQLPTTSVTIAHCKVAGAHSHILSGNGSIPLNISDSIVGALHMSMNGNLKHRRFLASSIAAAAKPSSDVEQDQAIMSQLGPVHTPEAVAPGASFFEFKE